MKDWPKLKPYQEDLLKGIKKGRLHLYGMGRRTGKNNMTAAMIARFFEERAAKEWSEWRPTTSWIPRRSWYGKWIIGRMYKRGKFIDVDMGGDFSGYTTSRRTRIRQYISEKELFKWKLKYGANDG